MVAMFGVLIGHDAAASGYQFGVSYTGEWLHNVAGGLDRGSRYVDNADLTLEIEPGQAWGFGSGTLFGYVLYNNHTTFSDELVGDTQVVSNIDAPGALRLYELWYEFGGGPWSIRTGLYDLNSEFDVNDAGGVFTHSSHGIGVDIAQTGDNGPSIFPVTSLAFRFQYEWADTAFRVAFLDGVPGDPDDPASNEIDLGGGDGTLAIAELSKLFDGGWRLWGGYWRYSADFERPYGTGAGSSRGNDGVYTGLQYDWTIAGRRASIFVRYGIANEDINDLKAYFGSGFVIDGPVRSRPDDALGLAFANGIAGSPYRRALANAGAAPRSGEQTWTLTYTANLSGYLAIQPTIHYVRHPSATSSIDAAWIASLRFTIGIPE